MKCSSITILPGRSSEADFKISVILRFWMFTGLTCKSLGEMCKFMMRLVEIGLDIFEMNELHNINNNTEPQTFEFRIV